MSKEESNPSAFDKAMEELRGTMREKWNEMTEKEKKEVIKLIEDSMKLSSHSV